jgi:hypothetical protein
MHVKKVFDSVDLKFPIPEHTYLLCDKDFSVKEQKTKKTLAAYDPESWFNLVKSANSKKFFKVV